MTEKIQIFYNMKNEINNNNQNKYIAIDYYIGDYH